jgi:hypothetical protein
MEKKEFDRLRFVTQMNEMMHIIKTNPLKSQQDAARIALQAIQEQYKERFGEYSQNHIVAEGIVKDDAPELDAIVEEIGKIVETEINSRVGKVGKSEVKYKAQYVLEELIKLLQASV